MKNHAFNHLPSLFRPTVLKHRIVRFPVMQALRNLALRVCGRHGNLRALVETVCGPLSSPNPGPITWLIYVPPSTGLVKRSSFSPLVAPMYYCCIASCQISKGRRLGEIVPMWYGVKGDCYSKLCLLQRRWWPIPVAVRNPY